jgi:hypothetical protein
MTQIFGDLISYQDDGKGCAVIADKITAVSEHVMQCIDMRKKKILISACE